MIRIKSWWININASLWFVPTLMVLAALLLAYGLVLLDAGTSNKWTRDYPLLFGAGADGARGMLSAIASSAITVAALIFSLTLSTLATVSGLYTSRILRNFMRDRANQVVMGFFVSIFVYCLVVLRTVRGGDESGFIPPLAVSFALLMALVSIGMLIFFIHHIATSIQAGNIIAEAARETMKGMSRIFPKQVGEEAGSEAEKDFREADLHWHPIVARASGYIQGVASEELLQHAEDQNLVVRLEHRLGDFVTQDTPLLSVASYGADHEPSNEEQQQFNGYFTIDTQRSINQQDVAFGFRQIVDIALKALSPGINDTTTAVMCIDWLGTMLTFLANRELDQPLRAQAGQVRVIARTRNFNDFVCLAFDQIRSNGDDNVAVLMRLLSALETVARRTGSYTRRQSLRQQCNLIEQAIDTTLTREYEQIQVRQRLLEVRAFLAQALLPQIPMV
ncbi:DUF2254 domain-containing protein [Hymenobacter sp. ISL-91]|uniref:DUF2254 domain-containing protein n=1 Tax=Hymenobacter sp. ISL-91 TaxID=2819151 RepID=UPI001BEB5A19|nr:DUF2254 domain-containing protein [Hymenobacter sp. ISL-91]MBT2558568.1 DUF2254 domain-containing protein [Hymenobacter sp. ISL-91]